jgi:hypothetical protein
MKNTPKFGKQAPINLLVTLASLILIFTLTASSHASVVLSWPQYNDYVGTSDAKASTVARSIIEHPDEFMCEVHSKMQNPTTSINVIGWTWAACTNKCRLPDGSEFTLDSSYRDAYVLTGSAADGAMLVWAYSDTCMMTMVITL